MDWNAIQEELNKVKQEATDAMDTKFTDIQTLVKTARGEIKAGVHEGIEEGMKDLDASIARGTDLAVKRAFPFLLGGGLLLGAIAVALFMKRKS